MGSPQDAMLIEGREREGDRELPWHETLEPQKNKEGVSTPLAPLTSFLGQGEGCPVQSVPGPT